MISLGLFNGSFFKFNKLNSIKLIIRSKIKSCAGIHNVFHHINYIFLYQAYIYTYTFYTSSSTQALSEASVSKMYKSCIMVNTKSKRALVYQGLVFVVCSGNNDYVNYK